MDRALADILAGGFSHSPKRVAFVDADERHAGREIMPPSTRATPSS